MSFLKKIKRERLKLLLLALPFVVLVFMFFYVPLFGWSLAFFNYKPGVPLSKTPFVGLKNFELIFTFYRTQVLNVLRNTLVFSALNLLVSPIPMFFAIFLNEIRSVRFKKIVQTTTTLPYFISWIIIYSLAFSIFQSNGVVNNLLMGLGVIDKPTMLLGNPDAVYGFQTFLGMWKNLGWNAIIYIAAIAGIDNGLYDAAVVDGAGRWQKIRYVTIPSLMPTFFVLLLLNIGNMLSAGFDQYLVFNNALVADQIEVIDTFVYRLGLRNNDYSFATAVGILKTLVSVFLLFTANKVAKKTRGESIL